MSYRLQNLMLAMLLALTTVFVGFGMVGAEYAGQITLIPAVGAGMSGKYLVQAGDRIAGLVDEVGLAFRVTDSTIGGRLVFETPNGGYGLFDDGGRLLEVSSPVSLGTATWQEYEMAVAAFYGGQLPQSSRTFEVIVDGEIRTIIPDAVTNANGLDTAVDSKFVGNWDASIHNPCSPVGCRDFAQIAQDEIVQQAQRYADTFEGGVIYHTNSPEFAAYYSAAFDRKWATFEFGCEPSDATGFRPTAE